MKVKFIGEKENLGILDIVEDKETSLQILQTNMDDGYYSYLYQVDGTKSEIDVVREFCEKLNEDKNSDIKVIKILRRTIFNKSMLSPIISNRPVSSVALPSTVPKTPTDTPVIGVWVS